MKKTAALLLAALLLVPAAGLAEDEELTNEKEFVYALLEDGTAEIVGYTGKAKTLKIPAEIDGHPVTVIGEHAFCGNQTLTEITVPEGVKTIGHEAFGFCASLETLHLPDGLTELARGGRSLLQKSDSRQPAGQRDQGRRQLIWRVRYTGKCAGVGGAPVFLYGGRRAVQPAGSSADLVSHGQNRENLCDPRRYGNHRG